MSSFKNATVANHRIQNILLNNDLKNYLRTYVAHTGTYHHPPIIKATRFIVSSHVHCTYDIFICMHKNILIQLTPWRALGWNFNPMIIASQSKLNLLLKLFSQNNAFTEAEFFSAELSCDKFLKIRA